MIKRIFLISRLDEEIKDFLVESIESVGQLELLLYTYQNKHKQWSSETISIELGTQTPVSPKQMEALYSKGMLKKTDGFFSYCPRNEFINSKVDKLFLIYHESPVEIVTFLFTQRDEKLKGFADAFKFKKD